MGAARCMHLAWGNEFHASWSGLFRIKASAACHIWHGATFSVAFSMPAVRTVCYRSECCPSGLIWPMARQIGPCPAGCTEIGPKLAETNPDVAKSGPGFRIKPLLAEIARIGRTRAELCRCWMPATWSMSSERLHTPRAGTLARMLPSACRRNWIIPMNEMSSVWSQ